MASASEHYDVILDVGNALSVAISGLVDGLTYYFAVTAYDTSGYESAFSNEISTQPSASGTPPLPQPVADFSATPAAGVDPLTVDFTDASSGSITAWAWDFGDGTASTAQNPTHHSSGWLSRLDLAMHPTVMQRKIPGFSGHVPEAQSL
jgi:PKD repeat protein